MIVQHVLKALGEIPEGMTNQDISRVVLSLWNKREITPTMAQSLMVSVNAVNGGVSPVYSLETALAVIKHFSNTVDLQEK